MLMLQIQIYKFFLNITLSKKDFIEKIERTYKNRQNSQMIIALILCRKMEKY